MRDVTFVQPRYQYDSYTDMRTLICTAGYPLIYVDEMDVTDPSKTYIVITINGEYRPFIDGVGIHRVRSSIYAWIIERPGSGSIEQFRLANQELWDSGYVSKILVSDRWLASKTGFHYIPIGLTPELGTLGDCGAKRYDVIHLMCPCNRRSRWFMPGGKWETLAKVDGLKVAPNGWGVMRNAALEGSRYMVAIHQDDHPIIEPLRYTLAAAYGLPIVAEYSQDFFPYNEVGGIWDVIHNPKDSVAGLLDFSEQACMAGATFRRQMLERFSFRRCVEEYL